MQDKPVRGGSSNVPYLVAVVLMVGLAILAIVVIAVLRPTQDNMPLYVLITGFDATTTAAILAFMKSQETHLSVNSRLDGFIRAAERSARSEGELAGGAAERHAAEERKSKKGE